MMLQNHNSESFIFNFTSFISFYYADKAYLGFTAGKRSLHA